MSPSLPLESSDVPPRVEQDGEWDRDDSCCAIPPPHGLLGVMGAYARPTPAEIIYDQIEDKEEKTPDEPTAVVRVDALDDLVDGFEPPYRFSAYE